MQISYTRSLILLLFVLNVHFSSCLCIEALDNDSAKAEAHNYSEKAYDFEDANKFDSAMYFAIKALRINEQIKDSVAVFRSMHQIGMINIDNYALQEGVGYVHFIG